MWTYSNHLNTLRGKLLCSVLCDITSYASNLVFLWQDRVGKEAANNGAALVTCCAKYGDDVRHGCSGWNWSLRNWWSFKETAKCGLEGHLFKSVMSWGGCFCFWYCSCCCCWCSEETFYDGEGPDIYTHWWAKGARSKPLWFPTILRVAWKCSRCWGGFLSALVESRPPLTQSDSGRH